MTRTPRRSPSKTCAGIGTLARATFATRRSQLAPREYFDEVEARKYFVEPHIPGFAEFDRWAGKRVLEVGCGIGTDSINFARAGAQLTAVDLSTESLNIARQRAEVMGVADRIEFVQANAEELTSAARRRATTSSTRSESCTTRRIRSARSSRSAPSWRRAARSS